METIRQRRNKQEEEAKKLNTVRTVQATDYLFLGFAIFGINMPKNYRYLYIIYSLIVSTVVTICVPLAFGLSYMNMNAAQSKLKSLMTTVHLAINVWGASVKIIIIAFFLKRLKSAGPAFEKLDARCVTPEEVDYLNGIVKLGRRLVVLFAVVYSSYTTITFLSSFVRGRPPYYLYNPFFDWRDSRLHFIAQSLIEYALVTATGCQSALDDSYSAIYVCILRTHMQIIIERIEKLASRDSSNWSKNTKELKMCIEDHNNLIEAYNIISPVISATIFVQFMVTAALIGTTLFNILVFATDLSSRVGSCVFLFAIVLQILPLCYISECLLYDNERLTQTIFYSNWIEQNVSYRKMILFFIQRSQQRMELTAGKIFPITLNSFLRIAKFSFTFYTCIKEMGIKEKLQLN